MTTMPTPMYTLSQNQKLQVTPNCNEIGVCTPRVCVFGDGAGLDSGTCRNGDIRVECVDGNVIYNKDTSTYTCGIDR